MSPHGKLSSAAAGSAAFAFTDSTRYRHDDSNDSHPQISHPQPTDPEHHASRLPTRAAGPHLAPIRHDPSRGAGRRGAAGKGGPRLEPSPEGPRLRDPGTCRAPARLQLRVGPPHPRDEGGPLSGTGGEGSLRRTDRDRGGRPLCALRSAGALLQGANRHPAGIRRAVDDGASPGRARLLDERLRPTGKRRDGSGRDRRCLGGRPLLDRRLRRPARRPDRPLVHRGGAGRRSPMVGGRRPLMGGSPRTEDGDEGGRDRPRYRPSSSGPSGDRCSRGEGAGGR